MISSEKIVPFACSIVLLTVSNLASSVTATHEDTRAVHNALSGNKHVSHEIISSRLLFDIKLHGILLWASVGFLFPVGILVKRIPNIESGRSMRIIFYIHAITEICGVILATVAAVMSIVYFDNAFNNDHQRIGLAFYVLMWLQALTGIFRPLRGSKGRTIWFLFHWLMGITVSLLGIINIYIGLQAYHKRISSSKGVGNWNIIFTVELFIIFFIYLLQEKWLYIKKQGSILGNKPVQHASDQEMMSPRSQQKEVSPEQC